MADAPADKPKSNFRALPGILAFLGRYPAAASLSIGLLLVNIAIEMLQPQILGSAITQLRWHVEWGAVFQPRVYVWLFFSLVLVRAANGFLLGPIRNRLVQRVLSDIRGGVFDAIQRLGFAYHNRSNSGELISRATTDVARLQDFLFACLFLSFDILVALVVIIILIFVTSPLLGWITVLAMLPTIALIAYFASVLQPRWRKVHDLYGEMTTVIQENIAGVRVVKAFAKEQAEIAKFRARKQIFFKTLMDAVDYWATRVPLAQLVFGLSSPLILWAGGRQVIRGELLIGDLAKVVFYLMAIGHRMGMVGQFTQIIQTASSSAERILEILRAPDRLPNGTRPLPAGGGEVRFERVGFEYATGKPALIDVSFTARAGQTIAVVGPTGAGKTTLLNLIPRFYDPTSGRVLIDGVDARELALAGLRQSVGLVFQETFLFSATVAENLAYGRPAATRAEIEACARAARADEFIRQLEDGYDTVIGERGVTLSGGQKQRLAIARALLVNPRILILDDATASVDPRTEHEIQEAMRELCAGRTTFVVAHRLASVQHADQLIVLREGRLVENGAPAELLQRGGFYREVFEHQLKR